MIGKNIQEKRKALGLTQAQVAELLGVTPPAVNRWEKDLCYPDAALLIPLARLLKTNLDELFSFYHSLSEKERELIIEHCNELLISGSDEELYAYMDENLHHNPADGQLYKGFADILLSKHVLVKAAQPLIYLDRIAKYYETALPLLPEYSDEILYSLATVYAELGDAQKAEERWSLIKGAGYDKAWIHAELMYILKMYDAAIPEMERCILQKAVDLCFSLYLMRDTYLLNGNPEKSALAEQKADQVQSVFALWNGLQGFSKISKAVAQSNIDDEKESLSFLMNELKSDDQRISTCSLFSGIKQTQSEEESVPSTILLDDILQLLHPSDR